MLALLLASIALAAAPPPEERLMAVGTVRMESFTFAADEPKVSNPKSIIATAGHSAKEWRIVALLPGQATVEFPDVIGVTRQTLHIQVIKGELFSHLEAVEKLLTRAKGITVSFENPKIVIGGTPADEHARHSALMVQAAYYDEVVNRAAPAEDLCEKFHCVHNGKEILLDPTEPAPKK